MKKIINCLCIPEKGFQDMVQTINHLLAWQNLCSTTLKNCIIIIVKQWKTTAKITANTNIAISFLIKYMIAIWKIKSPLKNWIKNSIRLSAFETHLIDIFILNHQLIANRLDIIRSSGVETDRWTENLPIKFHSGNMSEVNFFHSTCKTCT